MKNRLDMIYGRTVCVEGTLENAERVANDMIDTRRSANDYRWKVVFERVAGGYILREKRHLGGYKWA